MKDSLKIAIAGATGYVGLELIKILLLLMFLMRDASIDLARHQSQAHFLI